MIRKPHNYKGYTASHGLRGRGGFNVDVKLEGEWFKFGALTSSLNPLISTAAISAQKAFMEKYRDAVKQNIKEGGKRFGYYYTSDSYVSYKAKHSGGGILLRWTDSFMNSVTLINKGMFHWLVGIPTGINRASTNEKRKQTLQVHEYANVLERGYPPYMPPRPIFRDTFKQLGGLSRLSSFLRASLIQRLARLGVKTIS